jgi:hypothetical protein
LARTQNVEALADILSLEHFRAALHGNPASRADLPAQRSDDQQPHENS